MPLRQLAGVQGHDGIIVCACRAGAFAGLRRGSDRCAALPKSGAVIGHASLGELIANLARVGNPHMQDYQLDQLLPLTARLQAQAEAAPVPDNLPVLGNNAYRLPLGAFRQQPGRQMDLPPAVIGGSYHYRICPVGSDAEVIAGRLAEVTGRPAASFSDEVLKQMIRLMRRDVRAGRQIVYDDPEPLPELLSRAILTVSAAAIDQRPTP